MNPSAPSALRPVHLNTHVLGEFVLPDNLVEDESSPLDLIVPPVWDDDHIVLMLLPVGGDGTPIVWRPSTPAAHAEAERLCNAARGRTWSTYEQLRAEPRLPGDWLVRWYQLGNSEFLTSADPAILFDPSDDAPSILTDDPHQAAVMTHDQAINLIQPLMEDWEQDEESEVAYFDAIRREEARARHRVD